MNSQSHNTLNNYILIVDDNPDHISLLFEILNSNGYKARGALNKELALQAINNRIPDLILLDIRMPDMSGIDFCHELKKDPSIRDIPIIFLSSEMDVNDKVTALQAGGVDYITKPFISEELIARIRTHLRINELQQESKELALFAKMNPAPVLRVDGDGYVLSANPAAHTVFGTEHKDISSQLSNVQEFTNLDWHSFIDGNHQLSVESEINGRHYQFVLRGMNELGVVHIYGSDITEHKLAEIEVQQNRDNLALEREMIEEIILRIRESSEFDHYALRSMLVPVERTNGDVLFAARRPDGIRQVMLGDFTGHGLSAALGGPMVSDIFYQMTAKDLSVVEIINEINKKIHRSLPIGLFMATCFVELDEEKCSARIWNAGILPDVMLYRGTILIERFISKIMPLGISDEIITEEDSQQVNYQRGDRIFCSSDGIPETKDSSGVMFGTEQLESLLSEIIEQDEPLEKIITVLNDFRGSSEQKDDITIVEINC